jgi:Ni/Fe-hydrogenase b-type cytochrome subunit
MKKVYIYGKGERFWHWIQALSILVLVYTGIFIHYSSPDGLDFLNLYNWHYVFGFILILATFIGIIYFLSNHNIKQFIPMFNAECWRRLMKQAQYYLSGKCKGEKPPFEKKKDDKLNPMQKVAYFSMLFVILPIQILSGLLMFFYNDFAAGWVESLGGFGVVATIHLIAAFLFLAFLIVHIYMTFLGKPVYNHYLGMIFGYELEHEEEA